MRILKNPTRMACIRAKSNARYVCQECGSTEFIQAHHQIPRDDGSLIVLCAVCHSKRHSDVPLGLFFSRTCQPYWENISAASLARQLNKHPRTIYRVAKRLNIAKGFLAETSRLLIEQAFNHPKTKKIEKPIKLKRERAKEVRNYKTVLPKPRIYYRYCVEYDIKPCCPVCHGWCLRYRTKTDDFLCQRCGELFSGKQVDYHLSDGIEWYMRKTNVICLGNISAGSHNVPNAVAR